jgi:hypothetical protein
LINKQEKTIKYTIETLQQKKKKINKIMKARNVKTNIGSCPMVKSFEEEEEGL